MKLEIIRYKKLLDERDMKLTQKDKEITRLQDKSRADERKITGHEKKIKDL